MERKHKKVNAGKLFEEDFRKSTPSRVKLYRLPDPPQSFVRSSGARFSWKNPFDYFLWDGGHHSLYALELKSVQGKTISFERNPEEIGKIHYHQIMGLLEWSKYGAICGLIIEFRDIEKTVYIDINEFVRMMGLTFKKSFSYDDISIYNIEHITIPQRKLKTRYRYDLESFLEKAEAKYEYQH